MYNVQCTYVVVHYMLYIYIYVNINPYLVSFITNIEFYRKTRVLDVGSTRNHMAVNNSITKIM